MQIGVILAAADLMISNNTLVSTLHCALMKGAEGRGVVIKDTSTNGTLLNGKKMIKGEEVSWRLLLKIDSGVPSIVYYFYSR